MPIHWRDWGSLNSYEFTVIIGIPAMRVKELLHAAIAAIYREISHKHVENRKL
jgi:hypothetical protein